MRTVQLLGSGNGWTKQANSRNYNTIVYFVFTYSTFSHAHFLRLCIALSLQTNHVLGIELGCVQCIFYNFCH